jgi:RNA polymerase sigma factor (sigma-70 family)
MERGDDAAGPGGAEAGDAVLIYRIRQGDDAAFGILYERHLPAARRLAGRLAERDAAEDAVQEAFTKVLAVLKRGGGPDSGFRPYLLTVVRRTVYDRRRADGRLQATGDIEAYDAEEPFDDPVVDDLERSLIARAFLSLPDRWQTVLWYTEIEDERPADVAPILGLTANGAAALAYRAREGLRQAYLQMHLEDVEADDACRPVLAKLGAYVRDALPYRDSRRVKRHLDRCKRCKGLHGELAQVNTALRDIIGPLVLGSASTAYLASRGGLLLWLRDVPRRQQMLAAAVAALAGAVALGLTLASDERSVPVPRTPPPHAAEPAVPPATPPATQPPATQPPAAKPRATKPPRTRPHMKRPGFARPPADTPRGRPSRPAPKPRAENGPPHAAPPAQKPSTPRPTPPAPPTAPPGGLLVHIELRVPPLSAEVSVHLGIGTPCGETRSIWHRTTAYGTAHGRAGTGS